MLLVRCCVVIVVNIVRRMGGEDGSVMLCGGPFPATLEGFGVGLLPTSGFLELREEL